MSDLYIDYELSKERNPYNTPPDLNRLVDKGVVRHLICNINPPDGYSHEDLYNHPIMVRILDEFDKMPMWSLNDIYTEMSNEKIINDVLEYAQHDDTVVMHFWQSGGGNTAIGHVDSMDASAINDNGMPAYITIGGIGYSETKGGTGGNT